jgi:DNA-binding transcriptional MerR regulator
MTQAIFQQATALMPALPDRKYFRIGEASSLLGVKPHVLRYWESEFPQIKPYKSRTGQRLYRKRDVEALQHIQRLLYQERYTIAGARQALRMMYENESPILEEILTEEAIEAAVAVDMPATSASLAVDAPDLAPLAPAMVEAKTMDVLEVVEEKFNQAQMAAHLKNARQHLKDLLQAIDQ